MIVLAIVATCVAAGVSLLAVFANGMASAPGLAFKGWGAILPAWGLALLAWLAWVFH